MPSRQGAARFFPSRIARATGIDRKTVAKHVTAAPRRGASSIGSMPNTATSRTTPLRTPFWMFHELQTLRRTLVLRAGRLTRRHGELTLTVSANLEVREELQRHLAALSAAA
jgi:hypothetical protein